MYVTRTQINGTGQSLRDICENVGWAEGFEIQPELVAAVMVLCKRLEQAEKRIDQLTLELMAEQQHIHKA